MTLLLVLTAGAQELTVTRFAGPGTGPGYSDGVGVAARFSDPQAIAADADGNLYVADAKTIRKITPAGVVSTLAGLAGASGSDDGRGAQARFQFPVSITLDSGRNLFVADRDARKIRRVSRSGNVTTVLGPTTWVPIHVAVDGTGNVYVTCGDNKVRRVSPSGATTVLLESITGPSGIAVNLAGEVLVAQASGAIWRVTPAGALSTYAFVSGRPAGLSMDATGNLLVALHNGHKIVRIGADGTSTTIAGTGQFGYVDGAVTAARFKAPLGVVMTPDGHVFVADNENYSIRKIVLGAQVTTFAGTAPVSGNGSGNLDTATFNAPSDVVEDSHGNLFVSDGLVIRKITPGGQVSTFAGGAVGARDGTGLAAGFGLVMGLAIDSSDHLYVAERFGNTIRKITPQAVVTTLAGRPDVAGSVDGAGTDARFAQPEDVAVDAMGNVYVADRVNDNIRKVTPDGAVTTLAGAAAAPPGSADGLGSSASFRFPSGLAIDAAGNVFVADTSNHTLRKISPAGQVTTFAGAALQPGSVDGTGAAARFEFPLRIEIDGEGILWVMERVGLLRRVTPEAVVTTVAGALRSAGTEPGTGTNAWLEYGDPGLGVDLAGNLYVTSLSSANVRRARLPGIADVATADDTTPPIHTTVSLSTTPDTATSWSWSILRRPAGSTAELSSSTSRNPTFVPDVEDRFVLLLRAEGPSGLRYSTVEIDPSVKRRGRVVRR